jgi:hypothetical protein
MCSKQREIIRFFTILSSLSIKHTIDFEEFLVLKQYSKTEGFFSSQIRKRSPTRAILEVGK